MTTCVLQEPSSAMAVSSSSSVESLQGEFPVQERNQDENKSNSGRCKLWFGWPMFQLLLGVSLVRLIIYLNKLYQDFNSVSVYYYQSDIWFAIMSVAALALPPFVYALYLTGESLVKQPETDPLDLSSKTINGFLLIPWQIKRHLDLLYFAAQRVCFWRQPTNEEEKDIKEMERVAETLEFFEDFYAGFLQIVLQLFILLTESQIPALWGQIVGSALSILSMIVAVRRRDDGMLTSFFSFFGWVSLMTSRVLAFSLVSSVIHQWILLLCGIHVLFFTVWVHKIAIESHTVDQEQRETEQSSRIVSSIKTRKQRITLWWLTFWFFGLPSLVYWPFMFQLKEHCRPQKFLIITATENLFLLCLWLAFQGDIRNLDNLRKLLLLTVLVTTAVALLFLMLYVTCKPKYTDLLVLHEMKVDNSHSYGIYYEFCDKVFRLPSAKKISDNLEVVRKINEML